MWQIWMCETISSRCWQLKTPNLELDDLSFDHVAHNDLKEREGEGEMPKSRQEV